MDWGALQNLKLNIPNLIALVGVDTVWENAASPKSYPSILYFQHPSFVRMRMGQHLRAEVGEFQPIDPTSVTTNPNISTVTFYPSFGLIGHHVLEQYRENTVLGGLGSTGGLYTILDLVFGFLFGKPLMAIMFNTKYISPFGFFITVFGKAAIQRKLSRKYPHLHSQEPAQQSVSTSAFLHDFVVDFGPKYDDCGDDEAGRGHDPSFEMRPRNITEESSEQSHLLRDDTRQSMRVEHASV
ncbi:hypothetical protein BOTBODRAFT_295173 [Botryobasidium botryosum FD-172 SS1]|uniref:Uncharacterized protein n=1 Tax=Botryobasidium botryosum (strain FD-172 SS1) TaxID=930990 RepID=A0A067M2L0_BOTB1|nr:hypothetical protein BOTBODRAFT_295173 [Botryobasidium botryosum FD-172 SS1]